MRHWNSHSTVEGPVLTVFRLRSTRNAESPLAHMATFPYMANAERCDGCMQCVWQCPVEALKIGVNPRRSSPVGSAVYAQALRENHLTW
jgi:NAD-dependent dihydropyrimidine dehydrogenase PreA subunit